MIYRIYQIIKWNSLKAIIYRKNLVQHGYIISQNIIFILFCKYKISFLPYNECWRNKTFFSNKIFKITPFSTYQNFLIKYTALTLNVLIENANSMRTFRAHKKRRQCFPLPNLCSALFLLLCFKIPLNKQGAFSSILF